MLKRLLQLLALFALALSIPLALAQRTPLLVYTALETDQLKAYKDAFEKSVKDVEIRWVRDSTGVITAKLLAEKANPQADVVFALAATSLLVLEQEGLLTPYAPKGGGVSARETKIKPSTCSQWIFFREKSDLSISCMPRQKVSAPALS